jgi:HSP20 family molecular chaperone IbpA
LTRLTAFSSPLLLGFDEVERTLERLQKAAGDGYPPYDIERLAPNETRGERLRITLAVAGFSADDLEVTATDRELVVQGRQSEEPARTYLHRGIAARQFRKTFVLADGIEVVGAALNDGLLAIDLARPRAERVARRIQIGGGGETDPLGKEL